MRWLALSFQQFPQTAVRSETAIPIGWKSWGWGWGVHTQERGAATGFSRAEPLSVLSQG